MVPFLLFETWIAVRFWSWMERQFGLVLVPADHVNTECQYSTIETSCQEMGEAYAG